MVAWEKPKGKKHVRRQILFEKADGFSMRLDLSIVQRPRNGDSASSRPDESFTFISITLTETCRRMAAWRKDSCHVTTNRLLKPKSR